MISLYRPGNSILHRLPAWSKLLGLAVLLATMSLVSKGLIFAVAAAGITFAAFLVAGFGSIEFFKSAWKFRFLIVIILIPQLIVSGVQAGLTNTAVILFGLLLATLVTMTTKTSEIVELIQRLTKSENFALLIGLSINSIAVVGAIASGIVEAGKARGSKPNTVRQLTNLFIVSLKQADDYAEALAARGVQV